MTTEVKLINGKPYVTCPQCKGTGSDGRPPFCDECFGGGFAPLEFSARFAADPGIAEAARHHLPSGGFKGSTGRPVDRSNKFAGNCNNCGSRVEAGAGICVRAGQGWAVQHAIGTCKAVQQTLPVATGTVRPNKFAGTCSKCGGHVEAGAGTLSGSKGAWKTDHVECPATVVAEPSDAIDLSSIPAGRYAVPNGATRLKIEIDKPTEGNWAGWIFVKDAAEYGANQRYGSQKPGKLYAGRVRDELRAILADPREAAAAYGHLTGTCGMCGRPLEEESSVARGIGPKCAQKAGW